MAHLTPKAPPVLRHFPYGRTTRPRITFVAALSASLLAVMLAAPAPSSASDDRDGLTQQKAELQHRIASSRDALDDVSSELVSAQGELDSAVSDLSVARSRESQLQSEVQAAVVREQQMEAALTAALDRLAQARQDLRRGVGTVAAQRTQLAAFAVSNATSQVTQLSTLGLVMTAGSTHAAIGEVQGANSALARQLADLQRLQANQVLLRYTKQRVSDAVDAVQADRDAAAANLAEKQALEAEAAAAASAIEEQVAALQVQRATLASAKADELRQIGSMRRERDAVERRLQAIAARRAAAHRAELAAQAAAAAAREARAAEDAAAAADDAQGDAAETPDVDPADTGALSWPVTGTYITSPYGMRFHPILHIWELHDGTDFHAMCGTPVYAAADGRVTSEYFNTGYGNRMILDHGFVDGVSLWTSYNHLTSFVASAGEQVSRGELIAYSGTTGYSTGCHLHFMVYVNGSTVDPMGWL